MNLPWWAIGLTMVLAVATSLLAARRPAKNIAKVPVVAALAGRPADPKAVHRSILPGIAVPRCRYRLPVFLRRLGWHWRH
jgi:hypothetical protein